MSFSTTSSSSVSTFTSTAACRAAPPYKRSTAMSVARRRWALRPARRYASAIRRPRPTSWRTEAEDGQAGSQRAGPDAGAGAPAHAGVAAARHRLFRAPRHHGGLQLPGTGPLRRRGVVVLSVQLRPHL